MAQQSKFLIVPPQYEIELGTSEVSEFTREQALRLIWRHTHKDFKGYTNGEKSILVNRGGTCLVNLSSLTDDEINDMLPYAVKQEKKRKQKA